MRPLSPCAYHTGGVPEYKGGGGGGGRRGGRRPKLEAEEKLLKSSVGSVEVLWNDRIEFVSFPLPPETECVYLMRHGHIHSHSVPSIRDRNHVKCKV